MATDLKFSKQIAVLVGGKGTRLGHLSLNTPKPLMPIAEGRVFLDYFLDTVVRQGFDDILLLAGHLGEQVAERYDNRRIGDARISVLIEPSPLGTGGAFRFARDRLAPTFIAANGDTLFDINIRAVDACLQADPELTGALALRHVNDAGRYGSVHFDAGKIRAFAEKEPQSAGVPGHINGGIYALRRDSLDLLGDGPSSIEGDLFPLLAAKGQLGGVESNGYFLDIGLPETLETARRDLPGQRRPALFLDRDGVVNKEKNYLYKIEDFEWIEGVSDLIKAHNDAGIAVVVVTNQAGVARGYYAEADVIRLHSHIQDCLHSRGAFIDAFYYCPYHHDAATERYRIADHPDRKPNPGMLVKAAKDLGLDLNRSVLIGDQATDIAAAQAVGVRGILFTQPRFTPAFWSGFFPNH